LLALCGAGAAQRFLVRFAEAAREVDATCEEFVLTFSSDLAEV